MKVKKVLLQAYYDLNGEYLVFPDNPLHNQTFENVDVKISKTTNTICGIRFAVDVITISGQEPIECKLVSRRKNAEGTLVIQLCQDWG